MDNDDSRVQNPRDEPITNNATEDTLPNEIKALSGRKFIGDELKTYGDAMGQKEEGMLQMSGFNNNSVHLGKVRATCQNSIDLQVDIQCYQQVCRDTRKSSVLQQFLRDTKKSDSASKSV